MMHFWNYIKSASKTYETTSKVHQNDVVSKVHQKYIIFPLKIEKHLRCGDRQDPQWLSPSIWFSSCATARGWATLHKRHATGSNSLPINGFLKRPRHQAFQLDEQNSFCPPQPLLCQMAPSILGLVLQRRRPDAADGKVMEELLGRQQALADSQEGCLERTPSAVFA